MTIIGPFYCDAFGLAPDYVIYGEPWCSWCDWMVPGTWWDDDLLPIR